MYLRILITLGLVSSLGVGSAMTIGINAAVASVTPAADRQVQAASLYRQGVLQYEKGDLEAAIALYTQAIALDSNFAEAYAARAGAWGKQDNYTAAIADYSAAIAIDDELAPAYGGRGLALSLEGDLANGVEDLWTAAQLFRQQNQLSQYNKTLAIIKNVAP